MVVSYTFISVHEIVQVEVGDVCAHEFWFFTERTLLNMILAVVRSSVSVLISPEKLIQFTPTVSMV